jgi:hypothetical protein
MKPIEFEEQNCVYAEDQPEYLPLPVFKEKGEEGAVTSCWALTWRALTWRERLRLLWTGRVWLTVWTFNEPLQPQLLRVNYPFVTNPDKESLE